jgi:regulator of cell morphogenesis and NO signaling
MNVLVQVGFEALQRLVTTSVGSTHWQNQLLADLITHITTTHHVFVREESTGIQALAAKVVGVHGKNHPELMQVQQVFAALAEEFIVG